jgi:hypothetical protein
MVNTIAIILGIFKFFDQVVWLVKKLEKTPVERRQEVIERMRQEHETMEKTGRPVWD